MEKSISSSLKEIKAMKYKTKDILVLLENKTDIVNIHLYYIIYYGSRDYNK